MSAPPRATAEQQAAAAPDASVWVTANAGTGKTHVLIDRVTRLLLDGTAPARILCLTFTKAAAAEMEERLFRRLGGWATAPDAVLREYLHLLQGAAVTDSGLRQARRLFARALETPGGLKIRTIHAFCESLLRRFPLEAAIPAHFQVIDERSAAELIADARKQVLAAAQGDDDLPLTSALQRLVRRIDEPVFIALMDEAVRKFRHAGRKGDVDADIAALYARLGVGDGRSVDDIVQAACARDQLPEADLRHAAETLLGGGKTDCERGTVILAFLDAPNRQAQYGAYLSAWLTQKGAATKRLITKSLSEQHPHIAEILLAEQQRIVAVEAVVKATRVAEASAAALRIGAAVVAAYEAEKSRHGLLDYDDLIGHTGNLLAGVGAGWVLYKLDGGLDHILVDEAQDTSPAQWEVIRLLSDEFFAGDGAREALDGDIAPGGRTIFAVGDEKQSIYSFQGADPASFAAMRNYFRSRAQAAGRNWQDVSLRQSFRSVPEVLNAVDQVFARALAREGLSSEPGEIAHMPVRTAAPGRVEIWPTVVPEEVETPNPWDAPLDTPAPRSSHAVLADRIVTQISNWLEQEEILTPQNRPIVPDDILILVRRRNDFVEAVVRKLKQCNIPVAGTDRMVLTDQMAVMDLIAAGQFALMPEDDLTLATLLRSPFVGMSEDDLMRLAADRSAQRLWHELVRRQQEDAVFADAHALLSRLLTMADFVPPFEFFATLLGPMQGRRRLLSRLGPDASDPIDEFLSQALQYGRLGPPSLQGFLHWVGAGRTEIKRDLEQGGGAVRVMTVHAAKGLEANIVFLPDCCALPDGKFDPRLLPVPDEGLHVWPVKKDLDDAVSAAARTAYAQAREAEYRRLLYVAMTRARDWLYIGGYESRQKRKDGCWYNLVCDGLLGEAPAAHVTEVPLPWGETGWRIAGDLAAAPQAPGEVAPAPAPFKEEQAREEQARSLPDWLARPAPAEPDPPAPLAPSRPTGEEPATFSPRSSDDRQRFQRGRLVHHLLQYLPDLAPQAREAAARRYLGQAGHGLDAAAVAALVQETLSVMNAPAFAPLFGPDSQAEVPLAGLVPALGPASGPGKAIAGQIDRLCVLPDQLLIVDYKTNRPAPRDPAAVPEAYLRQMAAYRAALRLVYPARRVRCALLWTDGPHLMWLDEARLDTAERALADAPS